MLFRRLSVLACLALAASVLAQPKEGKKYALLVGVKEYDHFKLAPLKYTENDVTELARLLRPAGYEVILLTDSEGEKDKGRKPTAENIKAALKKLLAKKTRRDTILVALSGHGLQLQVKRDGERKDESYFCPADAQLNDPTTLVSLHGLFENLGDCGAGLKLLLVDACRNKPKAGVRSLDIDSVPPATKGIAALFSCSAGQVSLETSKLKHGVFFHCVLEGLSGKARNKRGEVTWPTLSSYVIEHVKEEVTSLSPGTEQTPHEVKNIIGSPVLLRSTAPAVGAVNVEAEAERLFRRGWGAVLGLGRDMDLVEAWDCFRKAAEKGNPIAQAHVGVILAAGPRPPGVQWDKEEGRKWCMRAFQRLERAALKGDSLAQDNLGLFYEFVENNHAEALKWYRKAAAQNGAHSQYNLGRMYRDGLAVEKDTTLALKWYGKAAAQNHSWAQNHLGWMYEAGLGVKRDYKEAAHWYRKAAEQNNPWAQNSLGNLYYYGRGVQQSPTEAARYYRKSAEQGYDWGQYNLGYMYEYGQGVRRDLNEAYRWYKKAADQGNQDARKRMKARGWLN